MTDFLTLFMMLHGLSFLLLAMPKYNKQILFFPKKNIALEQVFKYSGAVLIALCIAISIIDNGVGVGIAWSCAVLTLSGSFLSVTFSMNSNKVAMFFVYFPAKLFGKVTRKIPALILFTYLILSCVLLLKK